jgi:DNA-binding CsgD family transcriptional regulator
MVDFSEGFYAAALRGLRQAHALLQKVGARWILGNLMAQFAIVALALGQPERAARLVGSVEVISEAVSGGPIPIVEAIYRPGLGTMREVLGDERFAAERQIGRRMTMDEVVAEALAIEPTVVLPGAPAPTTRSQAAPSFPDGLSAREVDVLRLMANGRTTVEIGKQLVIQPRTVETHITHVYQKTGCRNRAEATQYAQRHGLI